ncbi:Mce protein [Mycobacterium sp. SMC-21]|jgi:Mce-associated membrane protein
MTAKQSDVAEAEVEAETADVVSAESVIPKTTKVYTVRRTVCWAVGVLVLALGVAAGTTGWLLFAQHQRDAEAAQALDAARAYAVTLTTTDQKVIDKNFADIIDGATGEFKDAYSKAAASMRKMLIDSKVNTTGTVNDAAVKAVHGDDVDVLLSVKQVVTSSGEPDPRTDYVSVSMTMRKVGDRWLATEVLLAGADGKRGK